MKFTVNTKWLGIFWLVVLGTVATANDEGSNSEDATKAAASSDDSADNQAASAEQFLASLKMKRGEITLPGGAAKIKLPEKFVYLDSSDTKRLLTEGWGNPTGDGTLGMILPADTSPLGADGWGIVLTYEHDGYVSDEDADDIDYDELLKDMQDGIKEESESRAAAGYGHLELKGWALSPSYDAAHHKMVWAKELNFNGAAENTLNYNIRVLGREGVLVLNAVAGMEQLQTIRMETPALVAATEFVPGKRYEDFQEGSDRVAEYGLASLVAGGIAAKLGFFGKLGVLLLAFKKLILAAVIGLGVLLKKVFSKNES